ncbi:MAG: hypothetical protein KDB40_06420 [Acidimicrobiales bacterium]|nr:hypothetical protein [Acidimicrobiales bacterium]MCB9395104.1 hypothetical protein [Acidimicrobiaceae bacterium]
MTQEFTVPGEQFWTITPFRFSTPDGWSGRQTVDQLAYLWVEGEAGTNCGIQWKRVPAMLELPRIAAMSLAVTTKQFPDVKVGLSTYGRLGGRLGYVRVAEFTKPDGVVTAQVYGTFFGPRFGADRPVELFEIIGHCAVANRHRIAELQGIVNSFRFIVSAAEFGVSVQNESATTGDDITGAGDGAVAKGA